MVDEKLIMLKQLKILLSMLRFMKIIPAHAQKPKTFLKKPVSLELYFIHQCELSNKQFKSMRLKMK